MNPNFGSQTFIFLDLVFRDFNVLEKFFIRFNYVLFQTTLDEVLDNWLIIYVTERLDNCH